jgi:UDP-N-acetylmuramoyl-tripeptide--D-alanyl-D-alanine ligase
MATFGSQENIVQAKYELIQSLPPDGIAFFNAKNSYCVELYNKTKIKKILYGQAASFQGQENILGAMAVARELRMSDQEVSAAVREIDATFPGARIKKGRDGITVIDATYSANPDGVMAALEYLKNLPGPPAGEAGKKIIVMPCLIELGKASKEVHKRIGAKIAEVCDLAVITTADRLVDIKEGAKGSEKIVFIENPTSIIEKIKSTTTAGDVVLLEGRVAKELFKLIYVEL